jgi:hypothetical protein
MYSINTYRFIFSFKKSSLIDIFKSNGLEEPEYLLQMGLYW